FLDRHADHLLDEADALLPRFDHVAGADPRDSPLAVDADIDDEIAAGHLSDARVLLVDRVAFEEAAIGLRMLQKARPVPDLDGFQRGDTRADHLATARIAGHQVRLNESGRDFQVRLDVAAIDPGRDAVRSGAEELVLIEDLAVMIVDAIVACDL